MEISLYTIGIGKTSLSNYEELQGVYSDIDKIEKVVCQTDIISTFDKKINITLEKFKELVNIAQQDTNEIIFFYFAGHGLYKNRQHYLILKDGLFLTETLLKDSYFKGKHFFLILDCCYSGNVIRDYNFSLVFDISNKSNSKTVFTACDMKTMETDNGGYFTEDLLEGIKKCRDNYYGSLNIDSIFFEMMDISKHKKKNYRIYTDNFFTIDLKSPDPKFFSVNNTNYFDLQYGSSGETFKIDTKYSNNLKIYNLYIKLYEDNVDINKIYDDARDQFEKLQNVFFYSNGFEKLKSTENLTLIYCKYYPREICADLLNSRYISYIGDIKQDYHTIYPSSSNLLLTTENEIINEDGRAIEYSKWDDFEEYELLSNNQFQKVVENFLYLYDKYLKDTMIVWLRFINNEITNEMLFTNIENIDPESTLLNYRLNYKTEDCDIAFQLNLLYMMKKDLDDIKRVIRDIQIPALNYIYSYQTESRLELKILDCIISAKRNYSKFSESYRNHK